MNIWLADVERSAATAIDASVYSAQDNFSARFSPDSRFLAYTKRLKNRAGTIYIYDVIGKKSVQVSDGVAHTQSPVFDRNGKYLYFLSSPNSGAGEFDWGVLNGALSRPLVVRRVHALVLAKDTPSPLLPNNQPNPDAKPNESTPVTKIDFENISRRFVDLPLPMRDYDRLAAGRAGKLFLMVDEWKAAPGDFNNRSVTTSVYLFDVAKAGAFMFQLGKVGKIVGKRTYGGGIGPYFFTPRLVDGGNIQLPNRAAYNPDGSSWGIENVGVAPDYDVEITPQDFMAGKDSQLEKAVEVALAEVAKIKPSQPKLPVFPMHPAGKTISSNDSFVLPLPGSSFPITETKAEAPKTTTTGKYADYVGRFETPMGTLTFQQECEKFVGVSPEGERIELVPDAAAKDKFAAQAASVQITFERDAGGKVVGLTMTIPSGREFKGKKTS